MKRRPKHPSPPGLSEVADGMAHEFNNLLGAIQGFAALIVEDSGNDSLAGRHAARIMDASRCGLHLIEQIAMIFGQGGACRSPVDLSDLVKEVVAASSAAMPVQVQILAERLFAGVMVHADGNLLRHALFNLLANALDSLNGGGGAIDVSVRAADLDPSVVRCLPRLAKNTVPWGVGVFQEGETNWAIGGRLCVDLAECVAVVVTDTGTGIDGDVLRRAFEPFYSARERALHTGLGLSIVLGVTVAHCGAVVIDSAPGRGTRARMILPRIVV
jgi:two-component system, cell cycle sensor histidine kinase and response regulator CckA